MEKLFIALPFWIKNILVSIIGLRLKLRRSSVRNISSINDEKKLDEYHNASLYEALMNANDSPFYNDLFRSYGVDLHSQNIVEELQKLPLLSKDDVKSNSQEIALRRQGRISLKTSGTTGSGLSFYSTRYAESVMWRYFQRFRKRIGIDENKVWCGYFCGRTIKATSELDPPYWVRSHSTKQILFSNYHLNSNTIEHYLTCLNQYQPSWIHGYPSFLYLVAKLALDKGIKLEYKPKALTFGSESVQSHQKKLIELFFNTISFDLYCQTEGVAMFSQCSQGKMHVDEEFSYVEFLPVGEEGKYEVVGTSLFNFAFPFLRYKTGDIVEIDPEGCICGLQSRVVKNIDGRKEDYIELKNGTKLGRLDHIFKSLDHVHEAQIIQKKNNSIVFSIVKGLNYSDRDEAILTQEIEMRFHDQIDYSIHYCDKIPRTSSGKIRFVVKE